ncbi:hypothetical protein [Sinorhizobium medicae]
MDYATAAAQLRRIINGTLAQARSAARHEDPDKARRRIDDVINELERIARSLEVEARTQRDT